MQGGLRHSRPVVAQPKESDGPGTVAVNRRARFDFELGDRYEAGLALMGSEVRALREHGADLSDAWVDVLREPLVKGMRIPRLAHAREAHEEKRVRKLLLHANEAEQLRAAMKRDGMTLVVTRCYFKGRLAKLELAVARGKKKHDKRQAVKERDAAQEARQAVARGRRGD